MRENDIDIGTARSKAAPLEFESEEPTSRDQAVRKPITFHPEEEEKSFVQNS